MNTIDIHSKALSLKSRGHTIDIMWIAGHAGLTGNDLADSCAKQAAKQAKNWNADTSQKSFREVKCELRADVQCAWNQAWSRCDKGAHLHSIRPKVSFKAVITPKARGLATKYIRLCTGHSCLPKHMATMNIPGHDSPICHCGMEEGDVEHFSLHCIPQFTDTI